MAAPDNTGVFDKTVWQALLTPNRSLSRAGFWVIIAIVSGFNLGGAILLWWQGAWPVVFFMGADVALVWFAFRCNYRDGNCAERIRLTPETLIIEKTKAHRLIAQKSFTRLWLSLELVEDKPRELIGPLYIHAQGQQTEIGRFLSPIERKDFAKALQQALYKF